MFVLLTEYTLLDYEVGNAGLALARGLETGFGLISTKH